MPSPLCGTGIYANDVLCEIIDNLDKLIAAAEASKDNAEQALADLKNTTEAEVAAIAGIDYVADTSGVDKTYMDPADPQEPDYSLLTPTSPTLPEGTDALITQDTIDDIFNDAASKLGQVSVKDERDAVYQASAMGVGLAAAVLTSRLDAATQRTNARTSEAAIQQAIQTGVWKREDAKTIYGQHLTRYGAEIQSLQTYLGAETSRLAARVQKYAQDIQAEAERRGWSEMEIRDLLEQADKATGYAIGKAKELLDVTRQSEQAVAQLTIGLTQAIYAAANYNLSGSGSQSVSQSIAT